MNNFYSYRIVFYYIIGNCFDILEKDYICGFEANVKILGRWEKITNYRNPSLLGDKIFLQEAQKYLVNKVDNALELINKHKTYLPSVTIVPILKFEHLKEGRIVIKYC
jgi:hypothetical protein